LEGLTDGRDVVRACAPTRDHDLRVLGYLDLPVAEPNYFDLKKS
jgi:hypothetical protein